MSLPDFIKKKRLDVSIDTSGFCNARCESCPWPYMTRSESVMSLEEFKTVLERFDGYEFAEFAFNSINEPFADKTILEKIRYFIDSEIKTVVLFFSSNWLIPNQQGIEKFIALVVKAINSPHIRKVSLNATISGVDEQTYDHLQAGKKLEKSVIKYKVLSFSRASKNVIALIQGLHNIVDFKDQIVINIKSYGSLFSSNKFQQYWHSELIKADIAERFINSKVKILLNHGFTSFARQEDKETSNKFKKCSMNWLSNRLVIGPDGAIGLCCHEGARQVNLGSLIDTSLIQLVSTPIYLKQLEIVKGINKATDGHLCQKCEFYIDSE